MNTGPLWGGEGGCGGGRTAGYDSLAPGVGQEAAITVGGGALPCSSLTDDSGHDRARFTVVVNHIYDRKHL